jgi:hypothetical protein
MIEEFRHDLLQTFAGRPVFEFDNGHPEDAEDAALPENVEDWAWRVAIEGIDEDPDFAETFAIFLQSVDTTRVRALVVGLWHSEDDMSDTTDGVIDLLIEHAARFPALDALFLGDVGSDQCEVSWLHQADPGRLLAAFPRLREFGLRGTTELSMEPLKHDALEELTLQGGGLPSAVVRAVAASQLPALTGLDLYLGTPMYNGSAEPGDLEPILRGEAFPSLHHLGLRDAENADEIAGAVAHAPVVAQLESLDLSLGAMTDVGAAVLLAGQPLTHLKKLDLHHHYFSDEMMQRIWAALPGVAVDMDEQEEAEVGSVWRDPADTGPEPEPTIWRYIAVSE